MTDKPIEIRDLRDGKFLWIDKSALKAISEKASPMEVAVYSWLCYYANYKAQDCFPSVATLAKHAGVSRRTIMRALKRLEELRAVSIERTNGKVSVYKLLNVTGDSRVTGDMPVTGAVTPVSLVPATPMSHEQEIIEQEIFKETTRAWTNSRKLPYPTPSKQEINHMIALGKELFPRFNLFQFIQAFKKEVGYPPHPQVVTRVVNQLTTTKVKVTNVWAWFSKALAKEMEQFFANQNIKQNETDKHTPTKIGNILSTMTRSE